MTLCDGLDREGLEEFRKTLHERPLTPAEQEAKERKAKAMETQKAAAQLAASFRTGR